MTPYNILYTNSKIDAQNSDNAIGIIDYGAGNLGSVAKAFAYLGVPSRIVTSPEQISKTGPAGLVLPGVGAFGPAMERLRAKGYIPVLREYLSEDRPFLGICLGMQMLMQSSEEAPGVEGLGVVEGTCLRFRNGKVPQIGWNRITATKKSRLLEGIDDDTYFYFVHSYYCRVRHETPEERGRHGGTAPTYTNSPGKKTNRRGRPPCLPSNYASEPEPQWTAATTDYHTPFPSVFENGNRCAVQFHPEKSGNAGLKLLENWARILCLRRLSEGPPGGLSEGQGGAPPGPPLIPCGKGRLK